MENIKSEQLLTTPKTEMFTKDGRKTLESLQSSYDSLCKHGWKKELVYKQTGIGFKDEPVSYDVFAYLSPKKDSKPRESLWILSGIHGEEPAGPNAIAEEIETINSISKSGIPVVLVPLFNPIGYSKDFRYLNSKRETDSPIYMTDPDHLLLDKKNNNKPRSEKPSNPFTKKVFDWITKTMWQYRPFLVMDHHEDELDWDKKTVDHMGSYCYANGNPELIEPTCKKIADILSENDFPLLNNFKTRFGERTVSGFIFNAVDGSIDEFLAAPSFFLKGTRQLKPAARATFVIETTRDDIKLLIPLSSRIKAHRELIKTYGTLWHELHLKDKYS